MLQKEILILKRILPYGKRWSKTRQFARDSQSKREEVLFNTTISLTSGEKRVEQEIRNIANIGFFFSVHKLVKKKKFRARVLEILKDSKERRQKLTNQCQTFQLIHKTNYIAI